MIFHVGIPFKKLLEKRDIIERGINPEIHFYWNELDKPNLGKAEELSGLLKEKKLSVTFHAPFIDVNIGSMDPLFQEATLKRFCSLTPFIDIFSPEVIVIHAGYDPFRYDNRVDLWLEPAKRNMEVIIKAYEGSRIALENTSEWDPDPILKLIEEFSGEIFFCYDIAHAFVRGRVPLSLWLDALGDKTIEVHVSDNMGDFDDHLPPGEGLIDFRDMFRFFRNMGREPIYTLEVFKDDLLERALKSFPKVYQSAFQPLQEAQV